MSRPPGWTRIEPDTRAADPGIGASMAIADPLWLLGRQWWVGEFEGHDGGAPVRTEVDLRVEPIVEVARREVGSGWDRERAPLDALLGEPPAAADDERTAGHRGLLLRRLVEEALDDPSVEAGAARRLLVRLLREFSLEPSSPALRRRSAGTSGDALVDGTAVLRAIRSGGDVLASVPGIAERWLALLGEPRLDEQTGGDAFEMASLDHDVVLHGASGTAASASGAEGPQLSWDDFDVRRSGGSGPSETAAAVASRVAFDGQVPLRWWTRMSTRTDWLAVPAGATDLPRLVVQAAFAGQGTDWWLVPVQVATDALVEVTEVRLFDGFGEAVTARPTDDDAMRLWEAGAGPGAALCLAGMPAVSGEHVEETELRPDDQRNMVWAIERIVPGHDRRGVRRAEGAPPRVVDERRIVLRTPTSAGWIPYLREPGGEDLLLTPLSSAEGPRRPEGLIATDRLPVRRESLPVDGVAVRRTPRLARSHDGSRVRWTVRSASDVRTSGGPGLLHDVIETPEPIPE